LKYNRASQVKDKSYLSNIKKEDKAMGRNSNDDRSDSMNPNNDAYWDSLDNHADQLNPNNDEYQGDDKDEDNKDEAEKD